MHFNVPLNILAVAAPAISSVIPSHGTVEVFKRDAVLDARDLELAETHGVNLTQMFKHSVFKRNDGDHITIWVDRGYVEEDEDSEAGFKHAKRQSTRLVGGSRYHGSDQYDTCYSHDRKDATVSISPFTGGIVSIRDWAAGRKGYFPFGGTHPVGWRSLLVAGSNSGANALYRARVQEGSISVHTGIGTEDVRDDAAWTNERRKLFNGRYRAASYGWETCKLDGTGIRMNFEIRGTDIVV
ncbi:hypothetical protein FBEOM_871 [Fusarium beomiforme]|uniref:Ecp2 effector protein domain-containing protein n=1 Tax=Fusarium beomiforme TaxID=44412 RepID=A0A9P5AUD4_9HYPO|nr:hypothetical protein FBEOM_871 [Fusarium beomiforme]